MKANNTDIGGFVELRQDYWRLCSSCKKPIPYLSKYYECSVSTCTGKRTGYVFCSVHCWETHLPGARHRDAGAIEKKSPTYEQYKAELSQEASHEERSVTTSASSVSSSSSQATRRIVISSSNPTASGININRGANPSAMDQEVLVVVSKMKQYIKDKSDMNTSGDVADVLSDMIRHACIEAIDQARADGRKTVMARDFKNK